MIKYENMVIVDPGPKRPCLYSLIIRRVEKLKVLTAKVETFKLAVKMRIQVIMILES